MKILIVGATGGTGKALVRQALEQGHFVTAFVRNPMKVKLTHKNLKIVDGDVLKLDSLVSAMNGKDAVVCALGHKRWFLKTSILSRGTQNIITAMNYNGVKRLVCETALGIGDTSFKLGLYYTLFVEPVILYFYFRDKELQERYIKESNLSWTIVRPGQLTNGKRRGQYKHGIGLGSYIFTKSISREDVADFMLKQLDDDSYLHQTPAITY